jgi:ABC-type molybdate transport system substrate-binding protein
VVFARAQLKKLTKQFAGSVECESLVESGRPADSIASIAEERRAGVIVIASPAARDSRAPALAQSRTAYCVSRRHLCLSSRLTRLLNRHKNDRRIGRRTPLRDLAGPITWSAMERSDLMRALERPWVAFGLQTHSTFHLDQPLRPIPRCKPSRGEHLRHSIGMLDILCALIVATACDTINSYGAQTFREPTT